MSPISLTNRQHMPGCHRGGLRHLGRCHTDGKPLFTCPDCLASSPHPKDVENSYCFNCHEFKYDSWREPRCMEPTCKHFGDHDLGEAACPDDHAIPPARRT